ncbi:MAG: polyprenyl synthetase family protein [Clostridia bacterium]
MNYKIEYKNTLDLFDANLRTYFGDGGFATLDKGMEYSLFSGGKRIRPVIMLQSGKMFNASENAVLPFAAALEMIHTYSLIHDDLPCMDNDSLRRGIPTNHMIFGEGNAVLNGDSLLNLAFETMLNAISDKKTLEASRFIAKSSGRKGMCSGQCADLYFEKKHAELKDIEYINANKTGAILKSCFVVGGILGDATEDELTKFELFGQKFGELFQLTDDLLDKNGDESVVGKTLGKDESVDKSSIVNIYGISKAKEMVIKFGNECLEILNSISRNTEFFNKLVIDTEKRQF